MDHPLVAREVRVRLYLDYSALSYNCESFAVSCVTGQAATQQGKRAANTAYQFVVVLAV